MRRSLARSAYVVALAAGAGACALWASPSLAQTAAPPMGPIGALPTVGERLLSLDLTGEIQYDSNVARGNSALANLKQLHQDDIIYEPSIKVIANLPVGQEGLFLTGDIGYDTYQYNHILNRDQINLVGGGIGKIGRCGGSLTLSYGQHQTDEAALPLQVTQNTQTIESAGVQVKCSTGVGLGEFVAVQVSSSDNSASRALVDSKTTSVNGGLSYDNHLLGSLSLFGSYSTSDYSNADALLLAAPSFKTTSVGLSLVRPIGTRLKGSAEISYQSSRSDGPFATSFSGFGARGSLDYALNPRLNLNLLFERSVQPTIQAGSDFTVIESIQGEGRYRLSSRLSATLGASWRDIDYRTTLVTLPDIITDDRTKAIYGTATLQVGRHASLAFDLRRETRNTNLTIFDYTDYRAGVTAIVSF